MKYNHYHIRNRKPQNLQNDWAIAVVIDARQWPRRNRQHRGCTDDNCVGWRHMTLDEIEEYKDDYRLCWWRYYDWQTFINDELKYLPKDHPFIKDIYQWKEKYRNIPDVPASQLTLKINEEDPSF